MLTTPMRALVVEDGSKMGALLRRGLQEEGFAVDVAGSGEDGTWFGTENDYDVILLDVMLPDIDGFEVCRRLRAADRWAPILMLTARDGVRDRVAGLDAGADDYLVKPFAVEELSARVRALGRRGRAPAIGIGPGSLVAGPIALDETSRIVTVDGLRVDLSPREFALLECLLRHRGQVLSRDQLLDHAWPYDAEVVTGIVDTYVYFLRRKLGPEGGGRIETVRGAGYRVAA